MSKLENRILIKTKQILHHLDAEDLKWVRSEGNYLTIHTDRGEFTLKQSLRKFLDTLGDDRFIKIQKSYVIRVDLIEQIDLQNDLVYAEGQTFPLGRSYREDLIAKFKMLK